MAWPAIPLSTARPRLVLSLLCFALWLPGLSSIPPSDRDESRFVQATKQMVQTGDYVRIMNGTEARNRKPIGIHWLQAPFVIAAQELRLAGPDSIWPYRMPSLLGGLLAVLASFEAGLPLFGRRTALLGAGMLAACVLLVTEVHIAKTDAALLGATTLAMAVLARAYLDPAGVGRRAAAMFWLAMGAGVLLKGPITPMVAGLTTLALVVADRRVAWLRCLRAGWGVPLMLAVVVPWFVAIGVATKGQFFADAVGGDLGRKLTSGDDAHWGPPGLHLLLLPLLAFPTTAALPAALVGAWNGRQAPATRFLLAWLVPAWLVFEAAPTKLPHYTLPLYPALFLLAAQAVTAGPARLRALGAVLVAIVAVALAAATLGAPVFLQLGPSIGLPSLVAVALVGWCAMRATVPGRAVVAVVAAVLLYGAVMGIELPRLSPLWIAPRVVEAIQAAEGRVGRLGSVGYSEPSLMVLAGTGTQWLLAGPGAAALADGTVDVLLVGDRDMPAVQQGLSDRGTAARVVATVGGFNYSRGRWVTLTALVVR